MWSVTFSNIAAKRIPSVIQMNDCAIKNINYIKYTILVNL